MGKFFAGIFFTLVVLALGGLIVAHFGLVDIRADQPPSKMEHRFANGAMDAAVARGARDLKNPIQLTNANLLEGMKIYRDTCAGCHGSPQEPQTAIGEAFNPRAPQFMKRAPDAPDNETYYITQHGIRWTGMPGWGKMLSDDQIWKVTTFLSQMDKLPPAIDQEWKKPAPAANAPAQ